MDCKAEQLVAEAQITEELIMVLIDGDWHAARWVSNAEDGSPYGCTSFADANNMCIAIDMIEDARLPGPDEDEYIPSNFERREEAIAHEEEKQRCIRLEAARDKREASKRRRSELERYYESVTGNDGSEMTMSDMRSELKSRAAEASLAALASAVKLFSR